MSVSWGTQYAKLKTNLGLAANRLRLLQKKKTEQAIKARTEIADFLSNDKEDRARIRVESIIREDFIVEAYELLEMFCELLLARFGLIQQMKELDDGIAEAVSSLLWVAPRIGHEVSEFKVINDQLQHKYGKQFAEAARMNQLPEPSRVSPKLLQKLAVNAPSKLLVEKYLIEIARCANIEFTPDPKVMRDDDDEIAAAERNLINFMNEEQIGWSLASGGGAPPPSGNTGDNLGPGNGGNYGSSNFGAPHGGGGSANFHGGSGGTGMMDSYAQAPPPQHYVTPTPNADNSSFQNLNASMSGPQHDNRLSGPPAGFMPSEEAPYLPPVAQQQQPSSQLPQQATGYGQQPQDFQYPSYPSHNLPGSTNAPQPKTTEHIYEVPPSIPDDFLSQFPEPPSNLPSGTGGSGGNASNKPLGGDGSGPGENLDFDELAKRFKELKKRL